MLVMKFDPTNCVIGIIGLGYVGLPLAVAFSKKIEDKELEIITERKVIGYDLNQNRVEELKNNVDKTGEVSSIELIASENLIITNEEDQLAEADILIVTVPTPINESKQPDLNPLKKACESVRRIFLKRIKDKSKDKPFVIFESTVYPGATEDFCLKIIESKGNLKINKNYYCGYSPERINPGDKKHKLTNIQKVTSGSNEKAANFIDSLYKTIISAGTFKAKSIKIAEAAKVIENTQRDLNIALINELSLIFERMDIDTLDVLETARTKWNFLDFRPGLVGGHCIGVDPYYLTYKAEKLGYHPELVLAGRRINDQMSERIVEKMILKMAQNGQKIKSSKVLIMGFTFKENCPDIRNSKVIDLHNRLVNYGIDVKITDPLADIKLAKKIFQINIVREIDKKEKFDAVLLAVAHEKFKFMTINEWKDLCKNNCVLLDIKGIIPRELKCLRI